MAEEVEWSGAEGGAVSYWVVVGRWFHKEEEEHCIGEEMKLCRIGLSTELTETNYFSVCDMQVGP